MSRASVSYPAVRCPCGQQFMAPAQNPAANQSKPYLSLCDFARNLNFMSHPDDGTQWSDGCVAARFPILCANYCCCVVCHVSRVSYYTNSCSGVLSVRKHMSTIYQDQRCDAACALRKCTHCVVPILNHHVDQRRVSHHAGSHDVTLSLAIMMPSGHSTLTHLYLAAATTAAAAPPPPPPPAPEMPEVL